MYKKTKKEQELEIVSCFLLLRDKNDFEFKIGLIG